MTKNTNIVLAFTVVAISIAALQYFDVQPHQFFGADASLQDTGDEPKFVTCQSAVRLGHKESGGKYVLSSQTDQNYGSGSRQQVTTFTPKVSHNDALWVIREANDTPQCMAGDRIPCGSMIRLTHNASQRNLHSHHVRAALSGKQEISAYGNDGEGDGGDDWKVHCVNHSGYWQRGKPMKLQHMATNNFLQTHSSTEFNERNCGRNCPIMNHREAFAREAVDSNSLLTVVESGVFITH